MICFCACVKSRIDIPPENFLAKVGDRIITVQDFVRRAEYTPRPKYCRGDNYIQKKIVLNSLIAEKLFALEAGEENDLAHNASFQAYIKGRKEQAVRQWLYYEEAYKQVQLDTAELKRIFELAGRRYDVVYYSMPDRTVANYVHDKLVNQGYSFKDIFPENFEEETIPTRTVNWSNQEDPAILDALFSHDMSVGEVLDPLETGDGSFVLMKVLGFTDRPAVTDTDIQQRWNDVTQTLTRIKALDLYEDIAREVMREKKIEFFEQTFHTYADFVSDMYLMPPQEKERAISEALGLSEELRLDEPAPFEPEFRDEPFFTLDDKTWTVGQFEQLMQSHPLVFRKRRMSRGEFSEQFRLAVADLMRDEYLTEEAYDRGYGRVPAVKLYAEMWEDHFYALYHRNQFLNSSGFTGDFGEDYLKVIEDYLNPYVDSLQRKHSNVIQINMDAFEEIELTHIDMFVTQGNVPYPVMVPNFPILTTDDRLDFGRKSNLRIINQ